MSILDVILNAINPPKDNTEKVIKNLRRKVRHYKQRIAVFEDIALGIKNEDLLKMYKEVSGIEKLIKQYTVKRNIFV